MTDAIALRFDVTILTDGSCSGNPGPGGYCAILIDNGSNKVSAVSGGVPSATNNRMELTALLEALRALKHPCRLTIVSDSEYVIKCLNGAKRRANVDLWEPTDAELARHEIADIQYVKAHTNASDVYSKYNREADMRARTGVTRQTRIVEVLQQPTRK